MENRNLKIVFFWTMSTSIIALFLTSCSYRFSNLHVVNPYQINSIAIEPLFDTSSTPIPSQHFWTEMQKAFAKLNSIHLAPLSSADAVLLLHLKSASIGPTGTTVDNEVRLSENDPVLNPSNPVAFDKIRMLRRAGEYSDKSYVKSTVVVTVVHKHTNKTIFKQEYQLKEVFLSTEPQKDSRSEFLNYREKISADVGNLAKTLAERVIQDFVYHI